MKGSIGRLPSLFKVVFVSSVVLLLCSLGLMILSMNSESGWISIGVTSLLIGILGAALLIWALVWWLSAYIYK